MCLRERDVEKWREMEKWGDVDRNVERARIKWCEGRWEDKKARRRRRELNAKCRPSGGPRSRGVLGSAGDGRGQQGTTARICAKCGGGGGDEIHRSVSAVQYKVQYKYSI